MQIDYLLSSLEAELTAFAELRSPAYLRDALSAGCFVYGAGGFGRRVLALLEEQNIPCFGVIDRRFMTPGTQVNNTPIIHPGSLAAQNTVGKCLVIGIHNHVTDLSKILEFGRGLSFRDILWNADLPDALGAQADNYWLTSRNFIRDNFVHIRDVANLLADERSVETLFALIRYRFTGAAGAAPAFNLNEQYMPLGLLSFLGPITFVDGGAYDGDTYRHLVAGGIKIDNWLAFEPDPGNFDALTSFAATQTGHFKAFPCGLSDRFRQLSFTANEGTSSHVNETPGPAEMTVSCVALDDVINGEPVDYIKLDVEGAERAALLGMRKTIATFRPALAVSVYHRPEDLWVIPQTLAALAPYAKVNLRQHSLNAFESVVYAV